MITNYSTVRTTHLSVFKSENPQLRHHEKLAGKLHGAVIQTIDEKGIDWMLETGKSGVVEYVSKQVKRGWVETIFASIFGDIVKRILAALVPIIVNWIIQQLQEFRDNEEGLHSAIRTLADQSRA